MIEAVNKATPSPAPDWQALLPRFLYLRVDVPVIPIPILLFVPTILAEGLVGLAQGIAGPKLDKDGRMALEAARQAVRTIRRQGPMVLVDVQVRDGSRLSNERLQGPIRVRLGQW